MIRFQMDGGIFNFRVAGILLRDGKVLIHRGMADDFYAFPGGRVEMFEDTSATLRREFMEELGVPVRVIRLFFVNEGFFSHQGARYHELCFYYLVELDDPSALRHEDKWITVEDGDYRLEFQWLGLDEAAFAEIYPKFVRDRLRDLPLEIERRVTME